MKDVVFREKFVSANAELIRSCNTWELIYCESGDGVIKCEDFSFYTFKEGEVLVIPPNTAYTINSANGYVSMVMRLADVTFPLDKPTTFCDGSQRLLHAFEDMLFYFNSPNAELPLTAARNLLLTYLLQMNDDRRLSAVIVDIRDNISANFADCNYELDEYLKSLPFSYDYLRKLYKSELGITPHAYLNELRMQTAAMLITSLVNEPISKIALMCGFNDALYFSRVFKKRFG